MTADSPGPPAPCDLVAAASLWDDYATARPEQVAACSEYVVQQFGDRTPLVDKLLALVLHGPKRATAGLVADYLAESEPLPRVGAHLITCDGSGKPRAVLRTIELRLGPFTSVDASFAYDEGEDDRTLESWTTGHRRYFERVSSARGTTFTERDEVVFERFEVVWPPELAEPR